MKRTERPPLVKDMTLARYFEVVGIAYDSEFKELRALSAREKYTRRADGRHGGMLDLPPRNPKAFGRWFRGRRWIGLSQPLGLTKKDLSPLRLLGFTALHILEGRPAGRES